MKKNLNIKIDINMRKKLVIFSELLFLFIVIGSSTAMADTGSLEINTASEIQNNAINQTDSFPKLEHARELLINFEKESTSPTFEKWKIILMLTFFKNSRPLPEFRNKRSKVKNQE